MNQLETQSIQSIRRRLLLLLLRAFGIVVFLTVIMILAVASVVIVRNTGTNPILRTPTAVILESYYLGHGSWQGVESVLTERSNTTIRLLRPDWNRAILVDENGFVIIDHGSIKRPLVGMVFAATRNETPIPLIINGEVIGTLWIDRGTPPRVVQLISSLIGPTALISIMLGVLTLIIGLLLMRRMINPLSEVIAAAQAEKAADWIKGGRPVREVGAQRLAA